MKIYLYKNLSDAKEVPKNLTNEIELTGTIWEPTDVLNPAVDVSMFSGFSLYNYAYIPVFSRYYFCRFEVEDGDKLRMFCSVDPLQSFWDDIKTTNCHITRQEHNYNMYIPDARITTTGRFLTQVVKSTPSITVVSPGNDTKYTYVLNAM